MKRFVVGPANMTVEHTPKLIAHVHAGTLQQELQAGVDYCVKKTREEAWMMPVGQAAATTTPKEVLSKMKQNFAPDAVKFGGCFGMLDLEDRIKPFDELDVGRMRWACDMLDETHKFSKVLGDIVVRADVPDTETFQAAALRRVERDADIDVVVLSIYWHRPAKENEEHPLKDSCRDVIFSAQ